MQTRKLTTIINTDEFIFTKEFTPKNKEKVSNQEYIYNSDDWKLENSKIETKVYETKSPDSLKPITSSEVNNLINNCPNKGATIKKHTCSCEHTWECKAGKGPADSEYEVKRDNCINCILGTVTIKTESVPEGPTIIHPDPQPKSVFSAGVSFVRSTITHVANGLATVTPEQQEERLAKCRVCRHRRDAPLNSDPVGQCYLCKCLLTHKTARPHEFCPDNPPQWFQSTSPTQSMSMNEGRPSTDPIPGFGANPKIGFGSSPNDSSHD